MTGASERPNWSTPETRKADEGRRGRLHQLGNGDLAHSARIAMRSLCKAEITLLIAAQNDERQRALSCVDAALQSQHAGRIAAVIARFADRRTASGAILDVHARAAAMQRIAMEETTELASFSVELANEKRRLRHQTLGGLSVVHRAERKALGIRNRRQRAVFAVLVHQGTRPCRRRITASFVLSRQNRIVARSPGSWRPPAPPKRG